MKKGAILIFIFLSIMPFVNAQNTVTDVLGYALGVNTQDKFLALAFGLFIIITAVISKLANRFFTNNRNMSLLVSIVIGLLAVNFMPQDLYEFFIKYVVFIIVIAIILAPWILVDWFGRIPRKARHLILIVIYTIGFAILWKLGNYPGFSAILETRLPFFIIESVSFKAISYAALGIAAFVSLLNLRNTTQESQELERLEQTKAETRERLANARLAERRLRNENPGILRRLFGGGH